MFGLLDNLVDTVLGRSKEEGRKAMRARKKELAGDLAAAAEGYLAAELPGEAARVLLLQADSLSDPQRRAVVLGQAARVGAGTDRGAEAASRAARLRFDMLRARGGTPLRSDLADAAAALETAGAWREAAEAFALLGDEEAEIRVLKEAGAIDELEARLQETSEEARRERTLGAALREIEDHDRVAERHRALVRALAAVEGVREPTDAEPVQRWIDRIRARLLCGPHVVLELDGTRVDAVLGSEITIGRSNASIVVAGPGVSRQHVRLYREGGEPYVADLQTRNGTLLGGARLQAPLPVGSGVSLDLAGAVSCRIAPRDDGALDVEVAGRCHRVPLGPLPLGGWRLADAHEGDDRFVVLETAAGSTPPFLRGLRLGPRVELCHGDALSRAREEAPWLVVPERGAP